MADTLKQYSNAYLGTSGAQTLLVTAGASGGVVRNIHLCNTDTSARTVYISIGSTVYDASKAFYSAFSIPASGVHVANINIVLTAGQKIYGYADTGSKVVATISGVDL